MLGLFLIAVIFAFYFTLTFIESLSNGEQRIAKQSKLAALICFILGAIILWFSYR